MDLVLDLIEAQALLRPDKEAVVYHGRRHSYQSFNSFINRLSHWLIDEGIKTGDRVLLLGYNSDVLAACIFAVLKSGAIFVPLNPQTISAHLDYVVDDCKPRRVIVESSLLPLCNHILDKHRVAALEIPDSIAFQDCDTSKRIYSKWNSYPNSSPKVQVNPDHLAAIIYTSGSTKFPKGVMAPHRQIMFATSAINKVLHNSPEDTILCGLPFSFDYGLYQIFLAFEVGATLVIERDFSNPLSIPRILKLSKITGFPGVPSLFSMLLKSRLLERVELHDLRYITSTGDVFPEVHIKRLVELFPHVTIFPMYGLTECKRVSIVPRGMLAHRESSVGKALPGTKIFIVDECGEVLPTGAVGQLVVSGPHVMMGYWNDPEESSKRFHIHGCSEENLLYSGDYFRMDEQGFLYFVGRDESFIKCHGQKVSYAEVESVLCELDGVLEAAVIGLPDPLMGEAVCACLSVSNPSSFNTRNVREICDMRLTPVARPKYIHLVQHSLPKTVNGKIDRDSLKLSAIHESGKGNLE